MTLYGKLKRLLVEVEPLLQAIDAPAQKWIEVSDISRELQTVRDDTTAISLAYARAIDIIRTLNSYQVCLSAFRNHLTFKSAGFLAGYWGTFDSILHNVLVSSAQRSGGRVSIDNRKAYERYRELRQLFGRSRLQYQARARLYGVGLKPKQLSVGQGIFLYSLNRKERNDRQSIIQPYFPLAFQDSFVSLQPTEVQALIEVSVDRSSQNGLPKAHNSAYGNALDLFSDLADAIRLVKPGQIGLSSIELLGGFDISGVHKAPEYEIPPRLSVSVATSDRENIVRAYDLVTGGEQSDHVLSRSLHRFLLGRRRKAVEDRIVDYVIAWEILLLTAKGSAAKQELSYRFSVNGTSIASAINNRLNRREIFNKMSSAYKARSALLHGSTADSLKKALSQGQFDSASEIPEFLERNYREAIFWLASTPEERRPYLRDNGWELLLWPG